MVPICKMIVLTLLGTKNYFLRSIWKNYKRFSRQNMYVLILKKPLWIIYILKFCLNKQLYYYMENEIFGRIVLQLIFSIVWNMWVGEIRQFSHIIVFTAIHSGQINLYKLAMFQQILTHLSLRFLKLIYLINFYCVLKYLYPPPHSFSVYEKYHTKSSKHFPKKPNQYFMGETKNGMSFTILGPTRA